MDISALIGYVVAFGCLITGFLLEKGSLASLLMVSPIFIVIGGTIGATILSFKMPDIVNAVKSLGNCYLKKGQPDPDLIIKKLAQMSDVCRQSGLMQLQEMINDAEIDGDEYLTLKEGMILALDMKDSDEIRETLESDISAYSLRKLTEISVWEGMGGYSPTLGVIGTVMGLIQVLSNMSDAESLTKSIGVAFIATLYGVGLANLIYLPAANRLKSDLKREKMMREMMIDGICMVVKGENSRSVTNKLSLYYQMFPGGAKKYKEGINN